MQTNVQVNLVSGIDSALRAVTMLRRKGIVFFQISIFNNSLNLVIPLEIHLEEWRLFMVLSVYSCLRGPLFTQASKY